MSRFSLRSATKIIALDRFMRDRIVGKGIAPEKILVLPPWSQDSQIAFDPEGRDRFRKAHGLDGKFVVMYSGNHSPCHPLDTLLQASSAFRAQSAESSERRTQNAECRMSAGNEEIFEHEHKQEPDQEQGTEKAEPEVVFCFVGGGSEWKKIKARLEQRGSNLENRDPAARPIENQKSKIENAAKLSTVVCLPYQPFSELSASLSAADLHVFVMGDPFLGLVHPCKIYNILAVGAPVLYIGPTPSHVTELSSECRVGTQQLLTLNSELKTADSLPIGFAAHGDVDAVVQIIRRIRGQRASLEEDRSEIIRLAAPYRRDFLLPKLIEVMEGEPTHRPVLRSARDGEGNPFAN